MINNKFSLENASQKEPFCKGIDNWINEGSSWMIELIGSQYFISKNVLTEHKEVCLSISGAQPVKT